jgi:tetratricopeptide (TPR) repeat protein/outer membrane biosynthesis protein TonB
MPDSAQTYERSIEAAGIALASGDHATAERALRAAIKSLDGKDDCHLELATALIKLGTLKQEAASLSEAEELFRRALDVNERALGPEHLGLVPALKALGTTRVLLGKPHDAEPLLTRALAISERHLGEDHPDLVILLNDLTRLYLKQAAHAFAEPLLQRLLEMKRSKGEDHPEVATVLASLAAVRQALGRHEAAEQLWRRVLSIRERTLAPNHFSIATAIEQLAQTCVARGKVGEALHLFQRALTIRETTLGRDHASLRSSRERIADLELQASEDFFEPGASPIPATPSDRQRHLSDEELGITLAAVPVRERISAPREVPHMAPIDHPPRALERMAAPSSMEFAAPQAQPVKPNPAAYLQALEDIKDELEPAGYDDNRKSSALALGSVGAFLQKRRAAAAVVGVGVLTLPFAAWAIVGMSQGGQPKWVANTQVAEAASSTPAVVLSGAPVTDASKSAAAATLKDSAAARAAANVSRSGDKAAETKAADVRVEPPNIRMPSTPNVVVRLDSMRGTSAAMPIGGESVLRHLSTGADTRGGLSAPAAGTPQRARLIGTLPTPRYPAQQLRGRTGGEVRVRFDVDTMGRPVMSTFAVVGAPLPQLVTAVREVIPEIRFEPARSPWPESRRIVETVELAFQFAMPKVGR